MFGLLILIFSILYINLNLDDPGETSGIPYEVSIITYTLENSFGALLFPNVDKWADIKDDHPIIAWTMMSQIWTIYWISNYVMLVMMLNFIIAIMSQKYEEIRSEEKRIHFQL